jgi:cyanophycinase
LVVFLGLVVAAGPGESVAGREHAPARRPGGEPPAVGPLVLIGGGEDREQKEEVLRTFVELAGGPRARIVLVAAASTVVEYKTQTYRAAFARLGVTDFHALKTDRREEVDSRENLDALERATGVFFTGGDQVRLVGKLRNTMFDRLLHRLYRSGTAIAGTSAGAAMMGETMVDEGENNACPRAGLVELGPGLVYLPGAIVDPHFSSRGRLGRLLSALALRPGALGLGIDSDTALVVHRGERGEVIGEGVVTVVDAAGMTHNNVERREKGDALALFGLTLHTLPRGCGFNLRLRKPTDPHETRPAEMPPAPP